ncbi:MAG: PAS domain-containing protein [Myxococcales bacterium]|nr:PAS domain-containing protein [Myxococcales bacterium]
MTSPIKVLLVEASPEVARTVAEALTGSADGRHDLTWVDSLTRGLENLRASEPDVILLGTKLPDASGAQALSALRAQASGVPVVVIAGYAEEKLANSLVEHGAQDYQILEQIEFGGLLNAIRHAVVRNQLSREVADLKEWMEKTLSALDLAVFLLEPTGRTVQGCNFTAEKIFGLAREEMLGRSLEQFFPDRAAYREFESELQAAIESIGHFRVEASMRRAMGEIFPVACSARQIGQARQPGQVVLAIEDIGDRERLRREARARHRLALEFASACLAAPDEEGLLREVCRLAVGEGGYPAAFAGLVDASSAFSVNAQALRGLLDVPGPPVWVDAARSDGPLAECLARLAPVVGADVSHNPRLAPYREEAAARGYQSILALPIVQGETTLGALVLLGERPDSFPPEVVNDLVPLGRALAAAMAGLRQRAEERNQAERCRLSEERFTRTAQALPLVLFVSDLPERRLRYLSPAFAQVFGRSPEGMLGERDPWRESIHPEDRERVFEELGSSGAAAYSLSYRITRPDGAVRFIQERAFPSPRAEGPELFGYLEDVTATRQAAAEEDVRRERRLRAEKLESASRLAEGLARPLSARLDALDQALQRATELLPVDHPAVEALRPADEARRELQALGRRLLRFVRPGARERASLDLNAILRGALQATRKLLGEERQVTWYCQEPLPSLDAAPDHLEQLVLDLLQFASRASAPGAALVIETDTVAIDSDFCRDHPGAHPGDFVRLTLRLPGEAVLTQARERLFEPFGWPENSGAGESLALFSAHGVVRQNRGFIISDFPEGGGLVLRVHLPATDPGRITRAAPADPAQPARRTALIVEADPATAALIQRTLEKENYFCLVAHSGPDGLELGVRLLEQIELLVVQSDASGISGREVARRLGLRKQDLRVLFLAPEAADTPPDTAAPPGQSLRKPFSTQALRRALAALLESAAGEPQ